MEGACGGLWRHAGQGWATFPWFSRVQEPSLARGAPTPSLEPRRTPTSRDKRPSASIGLGGMGEGCEQMAYVRADP